MENQKNHKSGISESGNDNFTVWGGMFIITAGLAALLVSAIIDGFFPKYQLDLAKLAATGILMIMIGMAFRFPSLLRDDNHGLSTMRLVVFMIIAVFVTIVIKIGWNADQFSVLKLDANWTVVIVAALTGKAIQSIGYSIADKFKSKTNNQEKEEYKDTAEKKDS